MDTWTYHGQRPRVLLEDASLPHQIRLSASGGNDGRKGTVMISVSCTCMGARNDTHEPLGTRYLFPADEALAVWREHIEQETVKEAQS